MIKKALVLFSGGKDSTVALWWARANFEKIFVLSFNYNGRPKQEELAADEIGKAIDLEIKKISLPFLCTVSNLEESNDPPLTRQAFVPQRNLIFYSIASAYAEMIDVSTIVGGHIESDGNAYNDAKYSFFESLQGIVNLDVDQNFVNDKAEKINFCMPLIDKSDGEVIALGKELGAPIKSSWSCLQDIENPCGRCVSCSDRANAFSSIHLN